MNTSKLRSYWTNKKNSIMILLIDFLIIFSSYALFAIQHISADGYYLANANDLWAPWSSGRVVWGIILQGLTEIGVNIFQTQEVFVVVFIAALAWCTLRILQHIRANFTIQEGLLYSVPVLLGFINVYIQEWFIFAEATLFYAIGLITTVESAIAVSNRKYIRGFILLLIAVLCYQIMLSFFIVYALFFVYNKHDKKTIRSYIPAILIGGAAGIASIVAQKVSHIVQNISTIREVNLSVSSILSKMPTILKNLWNSFLDAQGILPPVILPLVIILALLLMGVYSITHRDSHSIFDILSLWLVILVSLGVLIAPIVISSESIWMAPRVLVGFFALVSMLALSALLRTNGFCRILLTACTLLLLLVNIFTAQAIGVDTFKNNALDHHLDQQAHAYIDKYEQISGKNIEHIAFYYDNTFSWQYPEIQRSWYDTNTRSILIEWERIYRINYNCSESYTLSSPSEEVFNQYFAGRNWDTFMPDEQFVMIDNTLHWCIY